MTTELQLSGTQIQYMSVLRDPGNARSAKQRSGPQQVPLAVVAADCKVLHLREKKQSKSTMSKAASLLSVYAARPVLPSTRASSDLASSSNHKKKMNSNHSKPLLQKRTNVSPTRSVEASHVVRRSLPSNSSTPVLNNADKKVTKVYLSQKQSSSVKDCGMMMPCAPPATPTPEHLQQYNYVPSLADIKAQRDMRQRLEGIHKSDRKVSDKKREEQLQQQKMTYKEKIAEQKKRQRQEIYALNKVMTDHEYKNFEELVKTRGFNE